MGCIGAACSALTCCCSMCRGCGGGCKGCGCDGCRKASQCGLRFNRFFYLGMFLIPLIVNIVFLFHEEYFANKFWNFFPAYKESFGYSLVWITNIRFVFTYFVYHCILLVFSLFGLCAGTMPVAKIMHRGLLFIKLPLLVGFYFLSYVFPNSAMSNFQYLSYSIGAVFLAATIIFIVEVGYSFVNGLYNQSKGVRVVAMIAMALMYGLAVLCFIFMYLFSSNPHVLGTSIVSLILNLIIVIISIANKHSSSFPISFMVLLQGLSYIYGANFLFYENSEWRFNRDCFYAFAAFGSIFNIIGIICFNMVELKLQPLFIGIDSSYQQEFGSFVSTMEDDDMACPETSYHYWAFHLVMIGGACYLSLFTCVPQTQEMHYVYWYMMSLGLIFSQLIILWCALWPMVAKNRTFR